MGMFNTLEIKTICPRCGNEIHSSAEIRFGLLDGSVYRIGDLIKWSDGGGAYGIRRSAPSAEIISVKGMWSALIVIKISF